MSNEAPEQTARILPAYEEVGERELSEALHQALGFASVCWEPMDCTGVFGEARVRQVAAEMTGIIGQYADDHAAAQQPQPAPGDAHGTERQEDDALRRIAGEAVTARTALEAIARAAQGHADSTGTVDHDWLVETALRGLGWLDNGPLEDAATRDEDEAGDEFMRDAASLDSDFTGGDR